MKIGIDARFYGPIGKGLGRYTQKLIENLEITDHQNEYYIFLKKENWDHYKPKNSNFKKVLANWRWYTLAEQIFMPIKINKTKIDLMHFPHFNVPMFYSGNFVVTIHDLILTQYPTQRASTLGPILYKLKHAAYSMVIKSAVRKAKKIITVSEYTKIELVKHFKVNSEKISVTYEAVDYIEHTDGNSQDILIKYGIKKPYLLYVGNAYPHKNLELMLKVFSEVKKAKPDYSLVLVGKEDYFFSRLKAIAKEMDIATHVVFPGFVADQDLPIVYKQADLYVFPSLCEGFGLPALEAFSYGLPVVASNSSCLPEILGQAAYYFDPNSTDQIKQAIITLLDDQKLRQKLINVGHERIKQFSWQKMAETTLDIYNSV